MMGTCKECEGQVSSSAETCPHCGSTDPNGPVHSLKNYLILGGIVMVLMIMGSCAG